MKYIKQFVAIFFITIYFTGCSNNSSIDLKSIQGTIGSIEDNKTIVINTYGLKTTVDNISNDLSIIQSLIDNNLTYEKYINSLKDIDVKFE